MAKLSHAQSWLLHLRIKPQRSDDPRLVRVAPPPPSLNYEPQSSPVLRVRFPSGKLLQRANHKNRVANEIAVGKPPRLRYETE